MFCPDGGDVGVLHFFGSGIYVCMPQNSGLFIFFLVHWIFASTILYCTWYLPMEISLFSWHVDGLMPRKDIEEPFYFCIMAVI
jgi:hypothetical protein